MERQVKRTTEIETCCNNIKLLTEMLNHYSPSSPSQDKELMKASEILCGHVFHWFTDVVLYSSCHLPCTCILTVRYETTGGLCCACK